MFGIALAAALLIIFGLPAMASADDGIVTEGGTVKPDARAKVAKVITDAATHDAWGQGLRPSQPPPGVPMSPEVLARAQADRSALLKQTGKTLGSKTMWGQVVKGGMLRAIPFVGTGIMAWSICDAISDGCFIFKTKQEASSNPDDVVNTESYCVAETARQMINLVDAYYPIGTNPPACDNIIDFSWHPPCSQRPSYPSVGPINKQTANNPGGLCDPYGPVTGPKRGEFFYSVMAGVPAPEFMGPAYGGTPTQNETPIETPLFTDEFWEELARYLNEPENGRTRQYIATLVDDDVDNPYTDGVKVPRYFASETYDQYVDRLRAAGLLGDLRFATKYNPAPYGTVPGRVFEVSPAPGTRVDVGTQVKVRALPEEGGETDPEPGTDPNAPEGGSGGTGGPVDVKTPPVATQCSVEWPTPDLSPFAAIPLADRWPFGVVAYLIDVGDQLTAAATPPAFNLPPIAGQSWSIDLSPYESVASVARAGVGWMGSISIVLWITGMALGRRVTPGDEDGK